MKPAILAHPYRRFLARALDETFYMMIAAAIFSRGFRVYFWGLQPALMWYLMIGVMMAAEPVCLAVFGTTIGKKIMGLRLRSQGKKLSYFEALSRTFLLFKKGMGYGIPGYELVRYFKSWVACKYGDPLEWDIEESYELRDRKKFRIAWYILMMAFLAAGNGAVYAVSFLPIHTGAITSQEFVENVMELLRYQPGYADRILEEDGHWKNDWDSDPGIYSGDMPDIRFLTENGIMTGFVMEQRTETKKYIEVHKKLIKTAMMAYLGSVDQSAMLRPSYWKAVASLETDNVDSFELECAGKVISCQWQVENGIYAESMDVLVPENEKKPLIYQLKFSVSSKEDAEKLTDANEKRASLLSGKVQL